MYRIINPSEEHKDYWLCFINPIRLLDWNYNESGPVVEINKEYKPQRKEFYAYFTKDPDQWGDDWDDPFHMSDIPYDDECDILKLPFSIPHDLGTETLELRLPDYYGSGELFSVQDVNLGAIPWMFLTDNKKGFSFTAGMSVSDFISTLESAKKYIEEKLKKNKFYESFEDQGLFRIPDLDRTVFVRYNTATGYVYFYEKDKVTPTIIPNGDIRDEYYYVSCMDSSDWEYFKSKNTVYVKKESKI